VFAQLAGATSLRDIITALATDKGKEGQLLIDRIPSKSALAYANEQRDWRLFEDAYNTFTEELQRRLPDRGHSIFKFRNRVFLFDATVVKVSLSVFDWALNSTVQGGMKMRIGLNYDSYLPGVLIVNPAKLHELNVARKLRLPKGSIIVRDRAFNDYGWFKSLDDQGVYMATRAKSNMVYEVVKDFFVPARKPGRPRVKEARLDGASGERPEDKAIEELKSMETLDILKGLEERKLLVAINVVKELTALELDVAADAVRAPRRLADDKMKKEEQARLRREKKEAKKALRAWKALEDEARKAKKAEEAKARRAERALELKQKREAGTAQAQPQEPAEAVAAQAPPEAGTAQARPQEPAEAVAAQAPPEAGSAQEQLQALKPEEFQTVQDNEMTGKSRGKHRQKTPRPLRASNDRRKKARDRLSGEVPLFIVLTDQIVSPPNAQSPDKIHELRMARAWCSTGKTTRPG
jgi:hypothetical protein